SETVGPLRRAAARGVHSRRTAGSRCRSGWSSPAKCSARADHSRAAHRPRPATSPLSSGGRTAPHARRGTPRSLLLVRPRRLLLSAPFVGVVPRAARRAVDLSSPCQVHLPARPVPQPRSRGSLLEGHNQSITELLLLIIR